MNTKAKICDIRKTEGKNCMSRSDIQGDIAYEPRGIWPRKRVRHVERLERGAVEAE